MFSVRTASRALVACVAVLADKPNILVVWGDRHYPWE